jgi:glycine/D-amino acid oxidase-like deaminating enzyme
MQGTGFDFFLVQMKLRSNEPFWLLKNGLIYRYPTLSENLTCDILIIGGGITGALMGYQLSKEGYQTVLVDKRTVGVGSTSASTAMIQYEIDEPLSTLVSKVGKDMAVDSYLAGVGAIDKLETIVNTIQSSCGFERKQSLYVASSQKDSAWLKDEYNSRKSVGLEVEWIDHAQLEKRYNVSGSGAICSTAAACLDAYRFTHDLINFTARRYSLKVFDHSEIVDIKYGKKCCTAYSDAGFRINCRYVVHASGYESQKILNADQIKLQSTYAFVSEPLPELPTVLVDNILWNTDDPYLYLRGTTDNRVIVGGADDSFKNPSRRDARIAQKERSLWKKVVSLMPNLKVIPDHAWAGTFGVTPDSLPYIGRHPNFPNSFFVLGFGGNGITFSVLGMEMITDALAKRPNKFLEYFKFDR